MSSIRHLDEVTDEGAAVLGGKGWNLALTARAGLPVPPAFCITSDAHRQAKATGIGGTCIGSELRRELLAAYERLGRGVVAVRSSATVEDGAAASFAGLQETILGVEGDVPLIDAVERCWKSIDSERARSYRAHGNVDESQVAMAVVVQRLVDCEVSGVLFTRDPMDATGQRMLVEAAWGLGESVVSGSVTPDRFHIDRDTGTIHDQQINRKAMLITAAGRAAVAEDRQMAACLSAEQLTQLAALGRQVESVYGEARDVEWGWADGRMWLLQARPITTAGAHDREQVRREEIDKLAKLAEARGTVWARYNLAEVLPTPTPMTWAIVRQFMSGQGGLGLMFRDLGFDPDPIIDKLGFIDLVCGRPYVNLSREAKLHFAGFPYGHNFEALKKNPERALYPQPAPDPSQVTFGFFLRLPKFLFKMLRAGRRVEQASRTLAERLRGDVFPQFAAGAKAAMAEDISGLSAENLLARLETWRARTLVDLARECLKSATLAATALAKLEQRLTASLGAEKAAAETRSLLTGIQPDENADLAAALGRLARGELSAADFLSDFGHRGPQEMELAAPRWRERPDLLPQNNSHAAVPPQIGNQVGNAAESSQNSAGEVSSVVATHGSLHLPSRSDDAQYDRLQTYMGLREAGKHYLMLGYAVIRQTLVAIGRRAKIGDGVFYLLPEELPRLTAGEDLSETIAKRQRRRSIALGLEAPVVLFSDDLEAIGRPSVIEATADLTGTPVSAGVAEGEALVLESPDGAPAGEGFILVCPSTDPAWVPLFLRSRGLVMETGGILSHGAIVAREFGLPAVVGIDQVTRRIRTGQRLRVDGNTGAVHLLD